MGHDPDASADPEGDARRGARPFPLDRFQREAIDALDRGESVLVAAPTGSGKTVVAEHAVDLALAADAKVFYTTPIKALSNQKYHDLLARLGPGRVGLLTGDTSRDPGAPVVVMTTEVLRNMLYREAPALSGLRYVVLDEVHFLQDEYRGPVWEEVIIHLAPDVRLVALSATVSNADELADWIRTVRGPTALVVERTRPVRLTNHFLAEERATGSLEWIDTLLAGGRPNPEGERFDRTDAPQRDGRRDGRRGGRSRRRWVTPRRVDVVELLAEHQLLPAICFVFSRAGCDDAVGSCLDAGLRLTTAAERNRIADLVDHHTDGLLDADLAVLGYDRWRAALDAGVAAHHAGMVPPFKEAVEACFVEGLVKVVFATETLALGINMPARTVVIEKLSKFTGERHELLTPAQYTQLTGRAGRRGIDPEGHAVVLWSPFVAFETVARLAASRRFVLTSAFRPTYNMAANLVRRYRRDDAHRLLNLSFAQFQADQAVVRLEVELDERRDRATEARAAFEARAGERAAHLLAEAERDSASREVASSRSSGRSEPDPDEPEVPEVPDGVGAALAAFTPGDVVVVGGSVTGRGPEPAAVLSVAHRSGSIRVRVLTGTHTIYSLRDRDLPAAPEVIGGVSLPSPFAPGDAAFQREVAARLRKVHVPGDALNRARQADRATRRHEREAGGSRRPDRRELEQAARRVVRLERGVRALEGQIERRVASLAARFDRLLALLADWGYVKGWSLTPRGERLALLYHECDLLVAEALEEGLFDDLDAPSLAGLASCLVYEHRSQAPPPEPWFPSGKVRHRATRLAQLAAEIARDERAAGLPVTRPPDPTFVALAHAWAAGEELGVVLEDEDLTAGDFVRNVKQLVDLLRQLGEAAPVPETAHRARAAADALRRGVVLASSVVSEELEADP